MEHTILCICFDICTINTYKVLNTLFHWNAGINKRSPVWLSYAQRTKT